MAQDLIEDVVERDVVGELDDREPQTVGLQEHERGNRIDVSTHLDAEAGQAALIELGDQARERLRRLAEGICGCEKKLPRLDPRQDIGDLHDVESLDDSRHPISSGEHTCVLQAWCIEDFSNCDSTARSWRRR